MSYLSATTATARTAFQRARTGQFTATQICAAARSERNARDAASASHLAVLKALGNAAARGTRAERREIASIAVAASERFNLPIRDIARDISAREAIEGVRP